MYAKLIHNLINFNSCIVTYENAYYICFLVRKIATLVNKENLYALQKYL